MARSWATSLPERRKTTVLPERFVRALRVIVFLAAASTPVAAQNYSGDARKVGMGGIDDNENIAASMVPSSVPYVVIPIPLGLIQQFQNRNQFDPTSTQFDPVEAIQGAANPVHLTSGRGAMGPEQLFVEDLVNGRLNRDLSTYRGFMLPNSVSAQGLASNGFGKTFKITHADNGAFQGIYVGAGPYFSFDTNLGVDPRLTDILTSTTAKYYPNSAFQLLDNSGVQLALSIIVGYRARLTFPDASASDSSSDGIYVAFNYRYLRGFRYFQPDVMIRFDTDPQGLVTINPGTTPLTIDDLEASSGTGRAFDVGVEVVRNHWNFGVGANGIGNQIDWTDVTLKRFTLPSLVLGSSFIQQNLPTSVTDLVVTLPVVTSGDVGYDAGAYAFAANVIHGFNGNSFHGGGERRFGLVAVRGGARYSRQQWDPTGGIGIGRRIALDVGVYGTHANLEN